MAGLGRLNGKVALVTAAGQGLGESISKMFAAEGAAVAVTDINRAEVERVGKEIEAAGGKAFAFQVDATRSQEVKEMVRSVVERWKTIDILVNAAGGFHRFAPITEISEEEWDRVITLNLKTTFLCTQAVAPVMMEKKSGRIISIASGAGIAPNPHAPTYLPYGAGKAGVIGFTKVLARDMGPYGVTVNAIAPGTTLTPRVRKVRDAASIEKLIATNPMRALVEPEDTAEAALFLASDASRFITGVTLNVNAGNLIL
ncbi:MAG TPA: SDR family NAD(P)-dependent oxidoreductase [Burkholderiales bacterium]|nr:SDR family NAD(P)-dependent oxidoreductase [Burkholderiales bacterium]